MINSKTFFTLLASAAVLSFAANASAADVEKANNTNNLNLGSSWVTGTPPGSSDVAVWDTTITLGITNALGQDTNWAGIQITTPGGPVVISPDVSAAAITVAANSPTLTYTTAPANPLLDGDRAYLNGTTAPAGFSFGIGSFYYVVNATATTFQLSTTLGGSAITPTTTGTAVNVNGPFLTLGASGLDGSGASETLTFNCPVALTNFSGNAIWNLAANVTLGGGLIGTNTLEKQGAGTLIIANAQSGPGSVIQVDSGIAQANTSSGTLISLNGGTFNVNVADGNPINVTAGGGIEQNIGGNRTWSGALTGSGPLSVVASSIHTWNGNNSGYTGTITETGTGTLRLSSVNAVSASTAYSINGTMNGNATGIFNIGSLAGSGTLGISSGTPTWSIGALNTSSDFTGVITGSGAIVVKTGTGTQNLSGVNTYAGNTVISNGVLQIGDGNSSGSLASPAVLVTNSTSVLSFNRGDSALDFTNIITGIGTVSQDGNGTTFLSGPAGGNGANTYSGGTILNFGILKFATGALGTGGITFNNGATLQWASGNTTDISSQTVTVASGATLDVDGNTVTLASAIGNSGTGGLTVKSTAGNGVLNLQGANTYSGGTTVSSGTLEANNSSGSATGSGNVSVNPGATLGGVGTISGPVDIQGILAPGTSTVGTLTVDSLTLESASTNDFQFNPTPANSLVVVTTSSGFIVNGGLFNFYTQGGTTPWTTPGTYNLIQFNGTEPTLDSTWTTVDSSNPHVANPQPGLQYSFSAGGGFLSVTIAASSSAVIGAWNVDANGNWSDATKWSSNPKVPHAAGDSATLGTGSALRTVTLDASESVGALTMSNNNSFVIANAGNTLTLDNSGGGAAINVTGGTANGIQTAVALNDNTTVTLFSGESLSISGTVGNSSTPRTLAVSGAGTLALSGDNTYGPAAGTTGTTLNGATLQVGNNNALGAGDLSIPANGTLRAGANGLSVTNNIDVGSGATATVDNSGNNLTLGGIISDSGSLTMIGGGTVVLAGTNTYSGNTTVNAGVLSLSLDANAGSTPNINLNGGLLLGGTLELDPSHNIGVGVATGTVGTNALIDAASGQTFQVDGIIASVGNSGTNNLIVNSLPGDNGTLVLNGANTFNGITTMSNGVLQVLNALALQDSTLVYNSGTVTFNGGISAATLGGLAGTNNLYLTNLNGAVVVLTVGNNNADTTYAGSLNDASLGSSLIKVGTGTLSLSGSNVYGGTTSARDGTLDVNGGSLTTSNTLIIGQEAFSTVHLTNGSITVPETTIGTGGSSSTAGAIVVDSGTGSFGNVTIGGTINGGSITINGGNVSFDSVNDRRDASSGAATFNQGLTINGGSTTVSNLQLSTGNSGADLTVSNGVLAIGDPSASGNFVVGTGDNGGRGGFLTVFGGTLTYLGTDGLLLNNSNACQGTAVFNGGTSTFAGITLNNPAELSGGNAVLNINGGTVYLGSVGLVENTQAGGATASITLTSGILGATADWSSSPLAPITLSGNFTIQAADTNATAYNITLSGVLSGNGGLTKTGAGTLTLSGANTYTNNTIVSAGTLDLLLPSLFTNSTVSVSNGATLQLDFAAANVVAGLVLNSVSKPPGIYSHSTDPAFIAGTGSIQIFATGPKPTPYITHVGLSGATLTISGTNGVAGGPYVLLQSTNVATPLSQWTPVLTNSFDSSGTFNLTNNIGTPNNPGEFYILSQ